MRERQGTGLRASTETRPPRDRETRERLLRTAARLFADRGFKRVTVRDICRTARANVAAVNYHFGDKLGLYREVLELAADALRATTEAAKQGAAGCVADEKLRRFVHVHLRRMLGVERDDWIHRLINREIADPTPALDTLVEHGLRPRLEYLSSIVAEILGCQTHDPRVMRCVISVQTQAVAYLPNAIGARIGLKARLTPAEIDEVARHIAEFSLAGIRALDGKRQRSPSADAEDAEDIRKVVGPERRRRGRRER